MNIKRIFLLAFVFFLPFIAIAEEDFHEFSGKHFIASYLGCNLKSIADLTGMLETMDEAVKASGATILDRSFHIFPPNGMTVVYMLSESHASIHTYPEVGSCFVDLFTCGEHCSPILFDEILRNYLKPAQVNAKQFLRHENVEEIPLGAFKE